MTFEGLPEDLGAWIDEFFELHGIDRCRFEWERVIGALCDQLPHRFDSSFSDVLMGDRRRKIVRALKKLGIRMMDESGVVDEEPEPAAESDAETRAVFGVVQLALPYDEFFRVQVGRMKRARADVDAIKEDVTAYADQHPELGLVVPEVMADIRRATR